MKVGVFPICGLVSLALCILPANPAFARCFLELTRPLTDPAPWSAACASTADPSQNVFRKGQSVNLLDAPYTPLCADGAKLPCLEAPGIPVPLKGSLDRVLLPEGDTQPPACFPHQAARDLARLGYANFDRSCFRSLQPADRQDLTAWSALPGPPDEACDVDEFGRAGLDDQGAPYSVANGGHHAWAKRFRAQYPDPHPLGGAPAHPTSAAEGIYAAYHQALESTDKCLDGINPGLASRVRQAMGAEHREGTGVVYRPTVDCREQVAYVCEAAGTQDVCDGLQGPLERSFRAGKAPDPLHPGRTLGKPEEDYSALGPLGCHPVAPGSTLQGETESPKPHPGKVVEGSPVIHIFNATALYGDGSAGAATVFHEFLHAAGAGESKDHDHGVLDNVLPPGDQVYACQALAFKPGFDKLPAADLRAACEACADAKHKPLCRKLTESTLTAMGCRL